MPATAVETCAFCFHTFDPSPRHAAGKHADFCSDRCHAAQCRLDAGDAAHEARQLGPIEDGTALERFRDWECHALHGDG